MGLSWLRTVDFEDVMGLIKCGDIFSLLNNYELLSLNSNPLSSFSRHDVRPLY
jgi:hypothetical protein